MPDKDSARRRYRERVRRALDRADEEFRGLYAEAIAALHSLTPEDLAAITPDPGDLAAFEQLRAVVEEASRANTSQAELRRRIEALGDVALRIARALPPFAALLGIAAAPGPSE